MASTRSWCSAPMLSTLAPSACQNAFSRSTASGATPSGGVRMHQRLTNSSGKPESGPDCSVPATGWPGMKCTLAGRYSAMSLRTADFTEPVSETIAPGFKCAAMSFATAPQAPTGTQAMTMSAPATASWLVSAMRSASPISFARARTAGEPSVATSSSARCCAFTARAIEEPIRPSPISVTRPNVVVLVPVVAVTSAP